MRWGTVRRTGYAVAVACLVVVVGSVLWTRVVSSGHTYEVADAPDADVIVVFGTQLAADRTEPYPVLRNRLDTALRLFEAGKATRVLVSGDAGGTSGDETAAMARYLAGRGVPAESITIDPVGLDSYETCTRARDVFKVKRVLLVSQSFHLYRAVAICRSLGVEADGVFAGCTDCTWRKQAWNTFRDWFAAIKAVIEVATAPG